MRLAGPLHPGPIMWGRDGSTFGQYGRGDRYGAPGLLVVDEGITSIGEALHRFFGGQRYDENVTPLRAGFAALRAEQPLD
jgi:hypothetical protein